MRNSYIFLLIINTFIFCNFQITAQESNLIQGTVISSSDGLTLPAATVVEIDKNNRILTGVVTDYDGNFVIKVNNRNNSLQVSFIGFKSKIVEIGNTTKFKIKLEEDIKMLEAVEVFAEARTNTGFLDVKDRDLTIPVAKMSTKEIEDVQASSIDEALQGRLAGVDIVSNSGDPGGGMSIRIRGVNTLKPDARPLIVVDNVPYKTEIASDFDFASANEEGYSQMLNISVNDIQEITVLKDAAATALYGTEAANGVLMIKTKRGTKGRPTNVNYSYRGTFAFEPDPLPMLDGDKYSTLMLEANMNVNGIPLNTIDYKEFLYDPSEPYYYFNYGQNTNWLKEIQQNGFTNNHDLSLSGGGKKASYYFSTNYLDQVGVTKGTGFNRLSTRLNLDYDISDKLKLTVDFSYAHSKRESSYDKDIRGVAYRKMPNMSIFEYDENGNETPNYFTPDNTLQGSYPRTYNVIAMSKYAEKTTYADRVDSKFSLNYTILEGLKYTFDIAFGLNNEKENKFLPQIATGLDYNNTYANRSENYDKDEYSIYVNNRLSYYKVIADIHQLTATLNIQSFDFTNREYFSGTTNSASSELKDPSIEARKLWANSRTGQSRRNGVLGMVHYSLLDRYLFSAGIRREGNSKFDKAYRYGFFPSLSAAWRLSSEPFMQRFGGFIDELKIKGSYGQNGQTPKANDLFFSNYNTFDWTYLGMNGIYPASIQLKNLKWETFTTNNIGVSLEALKRRILIDFEVYKNVTEDMLGNSGISTVTGYRGIDMNIGTMEVKGWDFSFRSYPVRNNNLTIRFDFNLANNYNIITEVAPNYSLERAVNIDNGEYQPGLQANNPLGSFYGFKYLGVYKDENDLVAIDENGNQIIDATGEAVTMIFDYPRVAYEFQPGDAKYADINHDGNINYQDIVYLGDANPDFTGGFGSMVQYKRLSLNVYFHTRVGNDVVNITQMYGENMFSYDNQTTAVLRRWRNPGDETDMPRALMNYGFNWLGSDRYVHKGTFLRMKYVTLSYNLPKPLVSKIGLSSLKLSTTLNNLLTFTKYPGQDPEITIRAQSGDIYTVGYDYSNTPRSKEITFNITASF